MRSRGPQRRVLAVEPDVAIEVKSDTGEFTNVAAKVGIHRTRQYLRRGNRPDDPRSHSTRRRTRGLVLDFDAIIDA